MQLPVNKFEGRLKSFTEISRRRLKRHDGVIKYWSSEALLVVMNKDEMLCPGSGEVIGPMTMCWPSVRGAYALAAARINEAFRAGCTRNCG